MKKIIIFFLLYFNNLYAEEFKLKKILQGLERPWSLSFIDTNNILVTEKPGNIKLINLQKSKITDITHNLKVLEDGQGGLLDILYHKNNVYVSYSENRSKGLSSTSVAKANFNKKEMSFENIF